MGQLIRVLRNGYPARIADVKYAGGEWVYFVTVLPDSPHAYQTWLPESHVTEGS
jgi:hypothetical protein